MDLKLFRDMTDNKILLKKIDEVKEKITTESFEKVDDNSISRFLVLIKLRQELKEAIDG